jgi:CubicO group peptidase (beta-lactamase class C family)
VPPTSARRHQPRRTPATALLAGTALVACGGVPPAPTPAPQGDLAVLDWSATTAFLDSAAASGAMPGAVLGVSYRGARLTYGSGRLGLDDPTHPDANTVYDLASLTKVVGLTTAVMLAVDEGRLDLDAPVRQYVPRFAGPEKDGVTLRQLLTHTSGLPAWRPLYLEAPTRDSALALVYLTDLETLPGMEYRYSDLGAILLAQAVETAWGMGLDSILVQRVFRPLAMTSTTFRPPASWTANIAPTEDDPWRGRIIRGEVHDENAARLEGVSGHAGLFSTTHDLLVFGEWLLSAFQAETPEPVCFSGVRCGAVAALPAPSVVPAFATRQYLVPGSSRALGWDTPSGLSTAGRLMSEDSFGHTGFTGTSIWIDPRNRLVVVLLTNRVHPSRENSRIGPVRRGVADLVVLTLMPDAQPRPDAVVEAR